MNEDFDEGLAEENIDRGLSSNLAEFDAIHKAYFRSRVPNIFEQLMQKNRSKFGRSPDRSEG